MRAYPASIDFNGEFHKNWDSEVSDLDDHPKEYDEELDVKPSLLLKSFNMLVYGWSKKELKTEHWNYKCNNCSGDKSKGDLYTCKICHDDWDRDSYELCEECYNKKEYVHEHDNFGVEKPPTDGPDMHDKEELITELERQYEHGNSNNNGKFGYTRNKFGFLDDAYFEDENERDQVYKEIKAFLLH